MHSASSRQHKPSQAKMQRQCDDFNIRYPIGTMVQVWTGAQEGSGKLGRVRGPAYILSGHTPVVFVTGVRGCVALSHVDAAPVENADA